MSVAIQSPPNASHGVGGSPTNIIRTRTIKTVQTQRRRKIQNSSKFFLLVCIILFNALNIRNQTARCNNFKYTNRLF